jgi:signal transduction histidine kinase
VPPDVEQHLLRIAQEAISNAVRHGSAGDVLIRLDYDGASVRLRIENNGNGFDIEVVESTSSCDHWGIANMRERAARVGGQLSISSQLGHGTVVIANVPLR